MTVRFRRSVKIIPGLRLNFNKNSTSLSIGPRGAHYTVSSTGRRTVSGGVPGTGLYAYKSVKPRSNTRKRAASPQSSSLDQERPAGLPASTPKPTLFSSRAEKAFSAFLVDIYNPERTYSAHAIVAKAKDLREQYETLVYPLNILSFLYIINDESFNDTILDIGSKLWASRASIFEDPILAKYGKGIYPAIRICDGISVTGILNTQQFGFLWVEVLQSHGKFDDALVVLHQMDANQLTAISMADIELSMKDYDAVLETTSNITNVDDATLILLVLRGIAFREQGLLDASLACLKEAVSKKSRTREALHRAHFERSITYEKMKKLPQARKDLELILADDPTNKEVKDRLADLSSK